MGELTAERLAQIIGAGTSHRRDDDGSSPRFKVGDQVLTTNHHPSGHTRLPRYAMGRSGIVIKNHGVFAFADSLSDCVDSATNCFTNRSYNRICCAGSSVL